VVDRFGGGGEEMEARHQYEQALRAGRVNVLVLAPTEERKKLAAEVLQQHGGHFINFLVISRSRSWLDLLGFSAAVLLGAVRSDAASRDQALSLRPA
jgi:hypothetical protein